MPEDEIDPKLAMSRRTLLSVSAAAGVAGGLVRLDSSPAQAQATGESASLPRVEVARLEDIGVGEELHFSYPDPDSPAVLLRYDGAAQGGVGPDASIVAFSTLCTHKGCSVMWNPDQKILICPCHWSTFDPAMNGRIIIGQGSHALPQVVLEVEDGVIYATGVDGLIFGRQTNVL